MISVFDPVIGEEEIQAVAAALRRGEISGSFGEAIPEFEKEFANYCGCKYGIAVSNGTVALQLAVAAAQVQPGEEVLVSASTNIATALAAYHNGAVAIAVDSETETWNLNLDLTETLHHAPYPRDHSCTLVRPPSGHGSSVRNCKTTSSCCD